MAPKNTVIEAIEAAVAAQPENRALQVHLAELLVGADRHLEALEWATAVLREEPDHLGALQVAAQAAEKSGDEDRARRYSRLAEGLSEEAPPQESTAPEEEPEKVLEMRVLKGGLADEEWRVEETELRLGAVAGLDTVKRRLELSLFAPLRNPEMRKYFKRSLRGGLLLYGPPGCGKTFVAKATAGELGARFMSVGLHDVLDMYMGESERKLHELFETGRRSCPCVIFIDEIDALGRKRSLQRNSVGRDLVNQLLAEMDSMGANNDGLFVLGATNHPWDVDTALRRPGRFDRMIFVGPPDEKARVGILEYHLRERMTEQVDLAATAGKTKGFSGADLAHLCDTAAERAMEASLEAGTARPIEQKDFKAALKEVKPSTRAWIETARNYAMFANEGGAYDELLAYLREARLL